MDIEGLGDQTAEALVERGLVGNIADLYQFSADDIRQLEGLAEKSSKNLHRAINAPFARPRPRETLQY